MRINNFQCALVVEMCIYMYIYDLELEVCLHLLNSI